MSRKFGAAAADYARFRAGFPDSLFDRLAALGVGASGDRVLDVGTGTGSLGRGFALRGCDVVGVDPDKRLLGEARRLDAEVGVTIAYVSGAAEDLPLAKGCADVVAAGQCWHWFEGSTAAAEFARVVRLAGAVVVAHFDWLPLPGSVVEATERLILKWNPDWRLGGRDGFHPESIPHLYGAGFREFESFSYDVLVGYFPEAWRGRIRASAGVGAALSAEAVAEFDLEHGRLLAEEFGAGVLPVPHRAFALVARHGLAS